MIPNHHVNEGFAICVWGFPPVQDLLITCALPSITSYQSVRCLGNSYFFSGLGAAPDHLLWAFGRATHTGLGLGVSETIKCRDLGTHQFRFKLASAVQNVR